MAHERDDIRTAIVDRLLDAGASFGDRVRKTRLNPLRPAEASAVGVYFDGETVEADESTEAPRELKRIARFVIEAWARQSPDDLDTELDDLALEIETAMDLDEALRADPVPPASVGVPRASDSVLESTEFGFSGDGDKPIGVARLTYQITYHTAQRVPDETEDFETAHITYDVTDENAPTGDDAPFLAEDEIELET